jgi:PST family polysaccharide transporter
MTGHKPLTALPTTSRIAQNLFAYGASEVASKASRLLVVVAVARSLDLGQIGVAAAALAAADILKALTENGVGQRIIAAPEAELPQTCATAHRIFWVWCVGLFLAQSAVGFALYAWGGSFELLMLILLLAGEYLFMPAGLVQTALAMRAGKLRQTAVISGAQMVSANLLSAALALLWPSALALILPRLLTAPFWLIAMRHLHPWTRDLSRGFAPLRPFLTFGWAVLGVELVKAMRLQADKLIVGTLMGTEALGLYFMAFNAGLSLANSFSVAFSTVLFPHLCASTDKTLALRQSILLAMGLITPAVVTQAILAPYYVPILFGDGWSGLDQIVSILCLVAIPTTLWSATASWLRATGRAQRELWVTAAMTAALMLNTALLAPYGLTIVTTGYAIVATIVMVGASLPVLFQAFGHKTAKV